MLHSCPVAEAVAEAVAAVALQATKELTGQHADTKNFRKLGAPMLPKVCLSSVPLAQGNFIILGLYRGYIGIMEKKMETTIIYVGFNIGRMETIIS